MAVAVVTSEDVSGTPDHAQAVEGFTLIEFIIKFTLEVIVEVAWAWSGVPETCSEGNHHRSPQAGPPLSMSFFLFCSDIAFLQDPE